MTVVRRPGHPGSAAVLRFRMLACLAALGAAGCAQAQRVSLAVPASTAIRVPPPANRTGDELRVSGSSALELLLESGDRTAVPDILRSEARLQLARRGYGIVPAEAGGAPGREKSPADSGTRAGAAAPGKVRGGLELRIEIRRWEPNASFHPTFIIAGLSAAIVDPDDERTLWSADLPARPVPTPGAANLGDAYLQAARSAMDRLLNSLPPAISPASGS